MKIKCDGYCGQEYDESELFYGPDPFQSEINDDYTPVWLCEACARESSDEI